MGNNFFFKVSRIINKLISVTFHTTPMILKLGQLDVLTACFNVKLRLWSDPLILVALKLFLPPNVIPDIDI